MQLSQSYANRKVIVYKQTTLPIKFSIKLLLIHIDLSEVELKFRKDIMADKIY